MSKSHMIFLLISMFLLSDPATGYSQDDNWTHFRGNRLDGIARMPKAPLMWGDGTGIKWKTGIHGKGWSSPVVYGNQIWITTAAEDGSELYAVCVDFRTGKIIYDIKVFAPGEVPEKHSLNTYATPTPCIENGYVYVHYGTLGTACINTSTGSVVWRRTDLKCKHIQGPGSSPVLYRDLLILHLEGTDVRYVIALNKKTGQSVWKSDRPAEPYKSIPEIGSKAYITPLIVNVKGRDLLISNGSAVCIAYDPGNGNEIWRITRGAESTIAMPFTEKGIIYFFTGFMVDKDGKKFSELLAINPDGKGDITSTNILWRKSSAPLQLPTPVVKDGLIYTVDSENNMFCIDAVDGKEIWKTKKRAGFNASPVFANGNIYFFSTKGDIEIFKAGRKQELVASISMKDQIWATPAFLRNSIILRTQNYLYRID